MALTEFGVYNGITVQRIHTKDGEKILGWSTFRKTETGTEDAMQHENLLDALLWTGAPPGHDIDRVNGCVIRKLSFGYGYLVMEDTEHQSINNLFSTLEAARKSLGWTPSNQTSATKPKSAQKG
jgi:hypothetical protein